ncbi:peroxisomal leader peptide-processing protease isoform X1 [Harmonia axyridis]|uniref:peroxisomal leader peptide-processing protease isoform X1 n=2 Tax=Harmonia axyridis TaxID=115357 RepID=UPI001E279474|nr:peroxisomal leader peptide-processing protease isoform X1 [Harmonia axyridis]
MHFQMINSVLVESRYRNGTSVFSCSGSMVNNCYVIVTYKAVANFFGNSDLDKLDSKRAGQLLQDSINVLRDILIYTHVKNEKTNSITKYATYFERCFQSHHIKESAKRVFRYWSFDSVDNHFDLMSLFIILKIAGSQSRLEAEIESWLTEMPKTTLYKGQNLKCLSSAFGNKDFMGHFSQGVVSNILGRDNCLIFSDMPLTPGSEGSPVFSELSSHVAIGIVISTLNWWKGEWLNFTVIADFRSLFLENLSQYPFRLINEDLPDPKSLILSAVESSVFQIYNGTIWGTAILINKEEGILITNAHVVETAPKLQLCSNNGRIVFCDVIFSNSVDHPIDIAVLKAEQPLEEFSRSISFSRKEIACGDPVYAVGFPIFPKEINPGATITKGHVSHMHPYMIKTTCSIHPGASGGAVLDDSGYLVAIIVCNAKTLDPINMTYPRLNMSIPAKLLEPILDGYFKSKDVKMLEKLSEINAPIWNFSSKL